MKWWAVVRKVLGVLTDALAKGRTLGWWDRGPK